MISNIAGSYEETIAWLRRLWLCLTTKGLIFLTSCNLASFKTFIGHELYFSEKWSTTNDVSTDTLSMV